MTTGPAAATELSERNRARLATAKTLLARIQKTGVPFTAANILIPFNDLAAELAEAGAEASLLGEVHPDAAVRAAADEIVRELSELLTVLGQDRPLYDALGDWIPPHSIRSRAVSSTSPGVTCAARASSSTRPRRRAFAPCARSW